MPRNALRAALKSLSGAFAGVALFSAAVNILMLAGPLFMLEVYDRVLPSGSVPTLLILLAFVVGVYALQSFIDAVRGRLLARMGASLEMQLGMRVYSTLVRLAVRRGPSELLRPVRDLEAVRAFLSGLGPTALFDLPWIPIYIGVVYALHPLLGWTAIAGAIALVVLAAVSEGLLRKPTRIGKEREEARIAFAEASGRNAEALSAMGLSGRMAERWRRLGQNNLDSQRQASDIAGGLGALSKGLRLVLQSALLAIGAYLVIDGQATGGVMIASSILAARALAPVDLAIAHSKAFIAARHGWRRLRELIEALPDELNSVDLPAPRKELAAEGVIVMPPGGERIIVQNVSFRLEAGQALGIVGSSASGKSSLARALVGVWPAARGKVRLDGATLDQWSEESRGRHIGYLPQSVELFAGTVAENIARFDPEAPDETMLAAARAAGVHDMIVRLPNGYATEVGEGGSFLSAGQRQRVALARALYSDPFLVVLDEPNSNLDSEGEAALTEAIAGVRRRNGVVVVIAHRPSALSAIDMILVMSQGRAQAFGPKDEVLRTAMRPKVVGAAA